MANKQIYQVTEDTSPNIDSSYILADKLNGTKYSTYKLQMSRVLSGYALSSDVPTKISQLTNDSGFLTQSEVQALLPAFIDFTSAPTQMTFNLDTDQAVDPETALNNAVRYKLEIPSGTKGYLVINTNFYCSTAFAGRLYKSVGSNWIRLKYQESDTSQWKQGSQTFTTNRRVALKFNSFVSGGETFYICLTNSGTVEKITVKKAYNDKNTLWNLKTA